MARKLLPLGDRLVIKSVEREDSTKSGIFLPDTVKERPQEGKVLEVGPGRVTDDGKRIPMDINKGDSVVYSKFAGTEFTEDDEEYIILAERDVLAKLS